MLFSYDNNNKCNISTNTTTTTTTTTVPRTFSGTNSTFTSPTQCTGRVTRGQTALMNMTPENINFIMEPNSLYSESTLKKRKWALELYQNFCVSFSYQPFPFNNQILIFIKHLHKAGYAPNSIADVIIPSLKRIHYEKLQQKPGDEIDRLISDLLKSTRKKYIRKTREPSITFDVAKIIETTPEGLIDKAEEFSLWLCAMYTGARSITMSNIRLGDIHNVIASSIPGLTIVQIKFRVTKGNPTDDHIISLEGSINIKKTLDAIYWLEQHLQDSFKLSLKNFSEWKLSEIDLSRKLWKLNENSMSNRFSSRAICAGYPAGMFSFHSLRSGFISSAIIAAGTDENKIKAVLEHTAYVARWIPNGKAQKRYVDNCTRSTIVCNRLLQKDCATTVIEPNLTSPEIFHSIKLTEPNWNKRTNYQSFFKAVNDKLKKPTLSYSAQTSFNRSCWRIGFLRWVKRSRKLQKQVEEICNMDVNCREGKNYKQIEADAAAQVSRDNIAELLNHNFSLLDELVIKFLFPLKKLIENEHPKVIQHKRNQVESIVINTRAVDSKGHKIRISWTSEEDQILISKKAEGNGWKEIATFLTTNQRSGNDCKDRYRVLLKNGKV